MAACRSHLNRTNRVVNPWACNTCRGGAHLDAGGPPVHAAGAQEGDLPEAHPRTQGHEGDAVVRAPHHLGLEIR